MRRPARHTALLLLAGSFLFGGDSLAPAQISMGPEFRVNTWTTYGQGAPAVAADPAGTFVVAWHSYKQGNEGCYGYAGTGCYSVFARRYDPQGQPLGGEIQVNVFTATTQRSPAVARNAAGDFVVAWDNDVFYFGPGSIFARRFDAQGTALSGQEFVNGGFGDEKLSAAVDMNAGGEFVVAWLALDLPETGISGRRFDSAGQPLGPDFTVEALGFDNDGYPAVALADGGEFVVAWGTGPFSGESLVEGRRFDADGVPRGGRFQINQTGSGSSPELAEQVASAGFVVVWNRLLGTDRDVFGRRFDWNSVPLGDEFRVHAPDTGLRFGAAVAADAAGDFLVVWSSRDQDGSDDGVFGRSFDASGLPLGDEFRINDYTTGAQRSPAVAATPQGDFLVTWESEGQDGSGKGVFGRLVRTPLFADGFETGDTGRWSATQG